MDIRPNTVLRSTLHTNQDVELLDNGTSQARDSEPQDGNAQSSSNNNQQGAPVAVEPLTTLDNDREPPIVGQVYYSLISS